MLNKTFRKIAVMTSGGDSPGMNPCIRAVVRCGSAHNVTVVGIENGYDGMIHGSFIPLGPRDVGGILQRGGTILRTARSEEFLEPHGQREAIRQMNNANIDGLIVIGGDGSLNGAKALSVQGVPVVGIPGSIDNDIFGTDMAIGVDTALNTIVDSIDKLRDTASSHSRAFLIETMGRHSGYLATMAGIVTGAEMVLIPEVPTPVEDVAHAVEDAYRRGKTHAIIVVAEGFTPQTTELSRQIDAMDIGFTTRVTILGHIQRGGRPTSFDRLLASRFGIKAVEYLLGGQTGVMTGLNGNNVEPVPISLVTSKQRSLPMEFVEMARMLAQ